MTCSPGGVLASPLSAGVWLGSTTPNPSRAGGSWPSTSSPLSPTLGISSKRGPRCGRPRSRSRSASAREPESTRPRWARSASSALVPMARSAASTMVMLLPRASSASSPSTIFPTRTRSCCGSPRTCLTTCTGCRSPAASRHSPMVPRRRPSRSKTVAGTTSTSNSTSGRRSYPSCRSRSRGCRMDHSRRPATPSWCISTPTTRCSRPRRRR